MNTDEKPRSAAPIRFARHPAVRAVAQCALMCALGANSPNRRSMKRDKCCP